MLELNWSDVNRRIYARQIIKSLTYLFLSSKRKSPYYERGDEPLFFGDYDALSGGRRSRFTKIADVSFQFSYKTNIIGEIVNVICWESRSDWRLTWNTLS